MEQFDYIKRDITWLAFNHRVLQEAKDKSVPLFERIKFLAIYSSNLDEFFRVRVASLRNLKELKKETRKKIEVKPKKDLKDIKRIVQKQQNEFGRIYRGEIIPALEESGIFLITDQDFDEIQQQFAYEYFEKNVKEHVNAQIITSEEEIPFLENKGLYFVIQFFDNDHLGIVNIPTHKTDRFVTLPSPEGQYHITFVDDVIKFSLDKFLDQGVDQAFSVKVSRDAEMNIEDEFDFPEELLNKIKKALKNRDEGAPTRFLYDNEMPQYLLEQIKEIFDLDNADLIPGARYHNFSDFFGFPDPSDNPVLHDPPMPPLPHYKLESSQSIYSLLEEGDIMLHFPYQQYKYVPQMIREAAKDPEVTHIKITLYRVASKSAVVEALLYALEKGKKVTAFIEAKARFDEASNIFWGGELEKANAKVNYSFPGIKVHTKLLVIERQIEDEVSFYAYLGTGNFNEKTAKLYCDHALITKDQRLAREVEQVFDLLERKIIIPKTKHLFVSPFTLRDRFTDLIEKEMENARVGKEAYMILKMNSLEDPDIINLLYEASRAGVKIQMIVRGICCLVPGVEGMSENIEVISLVGRFLEHARVYIFANGGKEKMYTASADWMTRNLDRRVEVAMPIYDPIVYQELRHIIDLQLKDNTKARIINAKQNNPYRKKLKKDEPVHAQKDTYEFLKAKSVSQIHPSE